MAQRLRAIAAFLEDLSSVVYIGTRSTQSSSSNSQLWVGTGLITSTKNSRFISDQWIPTDKEA